MKSPYGVPMSGVLHPEGPEPAQTYWLRRALVLVALLILVLVSVGVAGAMGATRQGAAQDPAAVPSASVSGTASDATSTPPSGSSGSGPSGADPGSARSPSPSPSTSSAANKADKADKAGPAAAAIATCNPENLKLTVAGKQMLKVNKPAGFTVTVRNDGDENCRLNLTRNDFELKVTTGKKLLWSSKACSTATFLVAAKLDLDQSMSWAMLWDGRGVAAGCSQPGPELKRGTYLTTATLTGVKPAELPVTLRP